MKKYISVLSCSDIEYIKRMDSKTLIKQVLLLKEENINSQYESIVSNEKYKDLESENEELKKELESVYKGIQRAILIHNDKVAELENILIRSYNGIDTINSILSSSNPTNADINYIYNVSNSVKSMLLNHINGSD